MSFTVTHTTQSEAQLADLAEWREDLAAKAVDFADRVLPNADLSRAEEMYPTPMGMVYRFKKGSQVRVLAAIEGDDITILGYGVRPKSTDTPRTVLMVVDSVPEFLDGLTIEEPTPEADAS